MTISAVLSNRRSVRAFQDRPIGEEDTIALFEAAGWAPSNGNRQPWHYIVRTTTESRAEMAECLTRGNQWALAAPLLATLVARVTDDGMSNGVPYAFYDCGLSAMCLTIEAETRGLRAHHMAGWIREPLMRVLSLPDGVEPITVIAIGYEGDPGSLTPELREKELRPRKRKPLEQVWTRDVWDASW